MLRFLAAWMLLAGFVLCTSAPASASDAAGAAALTAGVLTPLPAQSCVAADDGDGGWRSSGPASPDDLSFVAPAAALDFDADLRLELDPPPGLPALAQPLSHPGPCALHAGPALRGLLRPPDA